jgi:hypothetical protein
MFYPLIFGVPVPKEKVPRPKEKDKKHAFFGPFFSNFLRNKQVLFGKFLVSREISERFLESILVFLEISKLFKKKFLKSKKKSPTDRSPPRSMDLANFQEEKRADISLENLGSCVVHR